MEVFHEVFEKFSQVFGEFCTELISGEYKQKIEDMSLFEIFGY